MPAIAGAPVACPSSSMTATSTTLSVTTVMRESVPALVASVNDSARLAVTSVSSSVAKLTVRVDTHGPKRCSTASASARVAVSPDGVTVTKNSPL